MQEKIKKLASMIVHYSLALKKGDKVLITYQNSLARELVKEIIKEAINSGSIPYINLTDPILSNLLSEYTTTERIKLIKSYQQFEIDQFDAFVNIRYNLNDYEGKNVKPHIIHELGEALYEIQDEKINNRRWVLLNYPSVLDAYKAKMKIDEFENFAFDVMTVDYQEMSEAIKPLKELMEKTDKVRIVSQV